MRVNKKPSSCTNQQSDTCHVRRAGERVRTPKPFAAITINIMTNGSPERYTANRAISMPILFRGFGCSHRIVPPFFAPPSPRSRPHPTSRRLSSAWSRLRPDLISDSVRFRPSLISDSVRRRFDLVLAFTRSFLLQRLLLVQH